MPEKPPSSRARPVVPLFTLSGGEAKRPRVRLPGEQAYAELLAASNFSFLRGASHPEELAATASVLGLAGFSIADRNTLAGIVRGHLAAQTTGARYVVGCRLAFHDSTPDIAVWPTDRAAYGRLCRLLTTGNLRAKKGECHLDLADLLEWGKGMEMAVLPERSNTGSSQNARQNPPPRRGRVPLALARGVGEGEMSRLGSVPLSRPSADTEGHPLPQEERARQLSSLSLDQTLATLA